MGIQPDVILAAQRLPRVAETQRQDRPLLRRRARAVIPLPTARQHLRGAALSSKTRASATSLSSAWLSTPARATSTETGGAWSSACGTRRRR